MVCVSAARIQTQNFICIGAISECLHFVYFNFFSLFSSLSLSIRFLTECLPPQKKLLRVARSRLMLHRNRGVVNIYRVCMHK